IKDVKRVHAELKVYAFVDGKLFLQRHVEIEVAGIIQPVQARFQTEAARLRREEAGWVEAVPGIGFARVWIATLDIAHSCALKCSVCERVTRDVLACHIGDAEAGGEGRARGD